MLVHVLLALVVVGLVLAFSTPEVIVRKIINAVRKHRLLVGAIVYNVTLAIDPVVAEKLHGLYSIIFGV